MSTIGAPINQGTVVPPGEAELNSVEHDVFVLPTSFAQQRLWFLNQLAPHSPFYNIPLSFRLNGPLEVPVLEQSLNQIVGRHESLRTTFTTVEGEPRQVVAQTFSLPLAVVDLTSLPEQKKQDEISRRAAIEARQPFDLSNGPLVKWQLLSVAEEEHLLLFTIHHIISDGWSVGVLIRELVALYEANRKGLGALLPDLPVQYADFAVWQRNWIGSEEYENQLTYWKQRLDGFSTLPLITDRPRPSTQSFSGSHEPWVLSATLTEKLKALSEREGMTLFMTLLAGFQTLLFRYTNHHDIVVGSPIANRNHEEIEGLIGFFANSLTLRTEVSGDLSFRHLLQRVKDVTLGAYAHQDIPFDRLVDELQPDRASNSNPLFQYTIALQNAPMEELDLTSSKLRPSHEKSFVNIFESLALTQSTRFDIELHLWERDREIAGGFLYNTDLFNAGTIQRMRDHFTLLLEAVCANPETHLENLPLLTDAERELQLNVWNATSSAYPSNTPINQLFENQASLTPDAFAIESGEQKTSFEELNRSANQLAHYLQKLGVGSKPDSLVGVMLGRSTDLIVCMLGILKAGAAYVPIDPEYPAERLRFMIEDSAANVIITEERLLDVLPEVPAKTVCLDRDSKQIKEESQDNLDSNASGRSLAYVMYTSGSTGQPKGICIEHRSISRLVLNTDYVELTPKDRVAQASNVSFDAATFEIWGALLTGASLVIVSREALLSPHDLGDEILQKNINTLFLTTALFNQIAREVPTAFRPLRNLLFGGEAVDPRLVRRVLENGKPERLLHVYGPTETTTFATWFLVESVSNGSSTVPIGKPLANTQAYVLDERQHLVPIGVAGELYIGGDGVARGYLERPELTAERFVPDVFGDGEKLYRTGDLVRQRADGAIEFLGRRDHQVKLRGFRIELGEIESALREHDAVSESLVMMREDSPGDKRLVAYIATSAGTKINAGDLRRFLKDQLPEYMVPAAFVFLESLPLTPNGKVAREKLPAPAESRPDLEEGYAAPQSEVERQIAAVWAEVLQLEAVGRFDNFFELGGHSLHVTRVHTKLAATLGRELKIVDLFQFPTVEKLAKHLSAKHQGNGAAELVRDRAMKQKDVLQRRSQSLKDRRKKEERVGR